MLERGVKRKVDTRDKYESAVRGHPPKQERDEFEQQAKFGEGMPEFQVESSIRRVGSISGWSD